jgi:hypothetical protein
MPDEMDLPDIVPFPFHPHMIESELPVGIDILLSGKSARGLIIMDFDEGMIGKGYPINKTPDPITLLFIQREGNTLFEAQGLSMVKGGVAVVIINDTFLSKAAVILCAVAFSNNLDHLAPVLFPALVIITDQILKGVPFGHLQITVEFFQGFVNPRTHERLDPLGLNFDLVDIVQPILVGAGFIGGKLRMGISWHPSPPLRTILACYTNQLFLTRKRNSVKK